MNTYEMLGLYPHNIRTCEKVREAYESGQDIVSIIKATGTGKSYIGLNLALEHKDEKIASPKINFVVSTYYKGTGIEQLNKKLEEYIDTADSKESQINYI